jgi:hypothetical protein
MQNFNDRQQLAAHQEDRFINACKAEFTEKSLVSTNQRKVKILGLASYLPNILSVITASFFIYYLLTGYQKGIAILLGILLFLVILSVEAGKRGLITGLAKSYFIHSKAPTLLIVALISCFVLSMAASYIGGKQLVVETAAPPAKITTPEIEELKEEIAEQEETISRLQKTTWKGKVTRDAVKGINQAKAIQASLYNRLAGLENRDSEAYQIILDKHTQKHLNFGYLLGILAALADLFLFGLLWTAKRLKWEVAAIKSQPSPVGSPPANTRTSYQVPTIKTEAPQPNGSPRQIGFILPKAKTTQRNKTEKRKDEKSLNEKPLNGIQNNSPEVVKIVKREIVELTDRVKNCHHCNNRFAYYNSRAKYCSDKCRIAAWEARTGKKLNKKKS